MAQDKKSFLIYCDIINTIDHLTDEEKGKLFQHLLEYVNDMNPVMEDRVLLSSWKPIEQQLKRDLKKYEAICDRNSTNGALGGRPKKPKKPNGLIDNPTEPKKADTDIDIDNDTDKENIYIKFLLENHSTQFEAMRMKLRNVDEKEFLQFLNNKCIMEDVPLSFVKINARFNLLLSNWNKDTKETPKSINLSKLMNK
jgi:hypothetical protein